jgi:transposase
MVVADGKGVPIGVQIESASPHEATLIESTLEQVAVPRSGPGRPRKNPDRLIYDKAGDSDPLRERLRRRGIDFICPHRSNRRKPKVQDGRKLRRYCRRWKIERTIGWVLNFRRLVVRYEREISQFYGFVHLACLMITLRQL